MDERQDVFQQRRRHLRREIQHLRWDAEHWNRTHPDEEPLDWDPDGTLQRLDEELRFALEEDA